MIRNINVLPQMSLHVCTTKYDCYELLLNIKNATQFSLLAVKRNVGEKGPHN